MARDLTSSMITEVTASVLSPILMVEMFFDSGTLRLWTGIGTINWAGNDFVGAGHLLGFSGVEETSDLSVSSTKFSLSGVPVSVLSMALTEDYQNRKVRCYFGTLDNTGAVISDPYLLFSGKMDVMESQDSGETCTVALNAESDLVDLTVIRSRQYTSEDQKSEFYDDLGLDFVATIEDTEINWGVGVKE